MFDRLGMWSKKRVFWTLAIALFVFLDAASIWITSLVPGPCIIDSIPNAADKAQNHQCAAFHVFLFENAAINLERIWRLDIGEIFIVALAALVILQFVTYLSEEWTPLGWFYRLNPIDKFTFALVLLAAVTALIFQGQLGAMQGQLDAMEADQRPWISLNSVPTIVSPLQFVMENLPMVDLSISLKNTGKTPGRRVAIILKMVGLQTGAGDPLTTQERVCPKSPKPLDKNAKYVELTIFPGDIVQKTQLVALVDPDLTLLRAGQHHAVISAIVGCIDYQFVSSDEHHQTGMIFSFLRKGPTPQTNFGIDVDAGPYQQNDLQLQYTGFGTGPVN
jgi:hypothetical protein